LIRTAAEGITGLLQENVVNRRLVAAEAAPILIATLLATAIGCGSSPAAPQAAQVPVPPTPVSLAGIWSGTGSDPHGPETLTWTLTQVGSMVSGPVQMAPLHEDGSCGSCHKHKKGTVAGTLSGTTLKMTLVFPAGGDVVTPMCAITFDAEAPGVAGNLISATYSGDDSCEESFRGGTFVMAR
jgi:hypothetical protein